MNYFFVLGNHPALSITELYSRLTITTSHYLEPDILLAEVEGGVSVPELIQTIGGTIKAGKIVKKVSNSSSDIFKASLEILKAAPKQGKFNFGLSGYGKFKSNLQSVGLALKQELKKSGVSCRLVVSREKTLSSVVVEQNKLVKGGRELVYINNGQHVLIGITEAVQPFKDLSRRDYGRPARDDYSGMLPPKLAQMMINIGGIKQDDTLFDPFCGSGTIITEALLMGYDFVIGSDISKKAIDDTKRNVKWLQERENNISSPQLFVSDVRKLHAKLGEESVGAVISEGYLGPQRGKFDVKFLQKELVMLYTEALQVLYKLLKPRGTVVLALPAFIRGGEPFLLPLSFGSFKVVGPLVSIKKLPKLTARQTFLYGRDGQKVWREVVVLRK